MKLAALLDSGPAGSPFSLDGETWRLGAWDVWGQSCQCPDPAPNLLCAGIDFFGTYATKLHTPGVCLGVHLGP